MRMTRRLSRPVRSLTGCSHWRCRPPRQSDDDVGWWTWYRRRREVRVGGKTTRRRVANLAVRPTRQMDGEGRGGEGGQTERG